MITPDSYIPWGMYSKPPKGPKKLSEIPAEYFLWIYENRRWGNREFRIYIEDRLESFKIIVEQKKSFKMQEKIKLLFDKRKCADNVFNFSPYIKVKRRNDTLYVYSLRTNPVGNISAMISVGSQEPVPVPLGMCDTQTLEAIYLKLNGREIPLQKNRFV